MKRTSTVTTPTRHLTIAATLMGAALTATTGWAALAGPSPAALSTATPQSRTVSPDKASVPGMVELKGGRVTAGTTPKAISALMTTATSQGKIRVVDGETPQHTAKVGAFAIGKYEVTNEQYFEYVKATDTRPPEHWGTTAIAAVKLAHNKAESEAAAAARAEGGSYSRRKWTGAMQDAWWSANWSEAEWGIPKGQEAMAVTYVTYDDAIEYARWAGLRLPTEYEWTFAARGTTKSVFPWGDDWENSATGEGIKRAHTSEIGSSRAKPIGTFEDGASKSGVYDLAGSLWEWTTTPYSPYPKFKPNTYTFKSSSGKKKVTPEPKWNATFRIIKGGSSQNQMLTARTSLRQGAKRSQSTNSIGIRVASSRKPGVDKAQAIWAARIAGSPARTQSETFDYTGVVALDRWDTRTPADRPDGYSIIEGYEQILFAPRIEFESSPGAVLNRESRIQPVVLGFLSTTVPMTSPALPAGDYFVSYREKGRMMASGEPAKSDEPEPDAEKGDKKEGEEAEAEEEIDDDTPLEYLTPAERLLRQIDLKQTILIFSTVDTGEYVASMPTSKIGPDVKSTKAKDGAITLSQKSAFNEAKEKIQEDWMNIQANIRRSASRVIPFSMNLQVDSSALGNGWRTAPASARGK